MNTTRFKFIVHAGGSDAFLTALTALHERARKLRITRSSPTFRLIEIKGGSHSTETPARFEIEGFASTRKGLLAATRGLADAARARAG